MLVNDHLKIFEFMITPLRKLKVIIIFHQLSNFGLIELEFASQISVKGYIKCFEVSNNFEGFIFYWFNFVFAIFTCTRNFVTTKYYWKISQCSLRRDFNSKHFSNIYTFSSKIYICKDMREKLNFEHVLIRLSKISKGLLVSVSGRST